MSVLYLALITFGATGVVCFSFCFCAVLDEYVICLAADVIARRFRRLLMIFLGWCM